MVTFANYAFTIPATLDIILEPYFIFLVIRKSGAGMDSYRFFLFSISICNFTFSLLVPIWSAEFVFANSTVCAISAHLSSLAEFVVFDVMQVMGVTIIQLTLLMLIYASFQLTHPGKVLCMSLGRRIAIILAFTQTPVFGLLICNYFILTTFNCFNVALTPAFCIVCGSLALYFSSYLALAGYCIKQISGISKTSHHASSNTVKLVKSVVKNFVITNSVIVFFVAMPIVVGMLLMLLIGNSLPVMVPQMGFCFVVFYPLLSTSASILIFTPYRKHTAQLFKDIRCRISVRHD
ncbi:hypothetical protein L596_020133 [Steinernema carpocapsae]|uniref:G-protein coupled receptors family 1 profile domain-containing protein n=1 Tax=Steinernema carpocapsae TaxID=34508 RepID=A0A4U5MSM3_STECR|nr:hypothetical protein L596_020133 [Steinernema carpocapsae]